MNVKEFESFIKLLRKEGIKSLKLKDLSIELSEEALLPQSNYQKKKYEALSQATEEVKVMTEEELLAWNNPAVQ